MAERRLYGPALVYEPAISSQSWVTMLREQVREVTSLRSRLLAVGPDDGRAAIAAQLDFEEDHLIKGASLAGLPLGPVRLAAPNDPR